VTNHPPPAPDWILGDDGHWRPPPFDDGRAGPRPAPSGSPPPGPGPRGGPRRSRGGAVLGVIALVCSGLGIGAKALGVFDVVAAVRDEVSTETTEPVGFDGAPEPSLEPELVESLARPERIVLGPEGDVVCPGVDEVTFILEDEVLPPEIVREGVVREAHGVDLSGVECRYGDEIRMGKPHDVHGRASTLLRQDDLPTISAGFFVGSAEIDDPASGTITMVFADEDAVLEAFVQLPSHRESELTALAELALN
jgi:hypothetical protein